MRTGTRVGAVVLLISAVAMGAAPPTPEGTAPALEIMKELRRIESAQYQGKADARRLVYQEMVRKKPGDPLLRVYVAWCAMVSDEAWNQLKSVTTLDYSYPWAHYGMGRVYIAWKMHDQARGSFEASMKKSADFYPGKLGLAELARVNENWSAAEGLYREVLAVADDAEARAGLGLVLLKQGKKQEGRKALEAAIDAWPEQPRVLDALLQLAAEAKDGSAVTVAERLAELRPKDRDARRRLADLRFDAGDKAGAAREYERLIRLGNPEEAQVVRLVELYRATGDAEGEERTLNLLVAINQTAVAPVLRMATLRQEKQELEAVEGHLQEALAREPGNAEAHARLAQLRIDAQQWHEALDHFRIIEGAEGPFGEKAKAEVARLTDVFKLPAKPASGAVNSISWRVSASLGKFYAERKKVKRMASGMLRMRVRVDAAGVVQGVDVLEDGVKDPPLLGHAYFGLKDAKFPKGKREPVFEFEVGEKSAK